jgi:pyruvate formate lyase activating enzyme
MDRTTAHDDEKGMVFHIQRFSVHDGPGIRTTVFLKGCPLRCRWCSNPESQPFVPSLMVRNINCGGCGVCAPACPRQAITIDQGQRKIDRTRCNDCLQCVEACHYDALHRCGSLLSVAEIVAEVCQDRLFYKNSGGGMTLSGGEPLAQPQFARSLLAACREQGLHTALETSGHAPWEQMEAVLRFVDLTLFDLKHLDPERHRWAPAPATAPFWKMYAGRPRSGPCGCAFR